MIGAGADADGQQQQRHSPAEIEYWRPRILQEVANHDVTIIRGDNGCGKTTRIPIFLLESDPKARVIVVQPKVLAAISLAKYFTKSPQNFFKRFVVHHRTNRHRTCQHLQSLHLSSSEKYSYFHHRHPIGNYEK